MIKKLLLVLMAVVFFMTPLTACKKTEVITCYYPDGAPTIALAGLFEKDLTLDEKKIEFKAVLPELLAPSLLNGEADLAFMPLNMAAKTYNGGASISLFSVGVFGVLYIIGNADTTLEGLKNKVLVNIGRGMTPDLTVKAILNHSSIEYVESDNITNDKVSLKYVSSASEAAAMLKGGLADYIVVGEPAVSVVLNAVPSAKVAADIQELWKTAFSVEDNYPQAGIVGQTEVLNKIGKELEVALKDSVKYVKENPDKLKDILASKQSTVAMDYTAEIIDRCNVDFKSASDAKDSIEQYFNQIISVNPAFLDRLPDDSFYFANE